MNSTSFENIKTIYKREFLNYFNTPIGYVSIGIFILIVFFLLFSFAKFFDINTASFDSFFQMMRITFLVFVPSISMRLWAEEKKTGTIELLFTLPVKLSEVILGKYLAAVSFLGVALILTLFFPITLFVLSKPDIGLLLTGYLAIFLLGSSFIAMGIYISWLTKDQIVAFLITLLACLVIFFMAYPPVLQYFGSFAPFIAFLSVSWHFDSFSLGLLDSRNFLFFISFIVLFLYLNYLSIETRR